MGYLTSLTPEERFFRKVNRDSSVFPDQSDPLVTAEPTNCWMWEGGYNSNGYPRYHSRKGLGTIPYRISWTLLEGEIPAGYHLDHLCRNPGCVRPSHLEPVAPRTNAIRSSNPTGINHRKTHCSRGHEFSEENTIWDSKGHRRCRICSRMANTEWARKKREKERGGNTWQSQS